MSLPAVGDAASLSKTVTEVDVARFGEVSLDTNPVHFDEAVAAKTRFGGRIAHGMLAASLVSAVLGTRLPGPGTIYLSQTLSFKGPVRIGDTITATAVVKDKKPDKPIVTLTTTVTNQRGELVLTGEAVVLVEPIPTGDPA
ncbi:MAG: MaoC family dehydratase [Deltaproteobacteria bacterium]|nr:MaoC family dehydratase [Deltaproteobacteria bacterium]